MIDNDSYLEREHYNAFVRRLFAKKNEGEDGFMHAAAGMAGEAGEVLDAVKKHWVYGKDLEAMKIIEEMGDMLFYVMAMCNMLGVHLCDVIEFNMDKLNKRYPQGYTDQAAIERADQQK